MQAKNLYRQIRDIRMCYGVATINRLLIIILYIVSFAKEPYKRDDILQRRPMISRSLLIVATPYLTFACLRVFPHMVLLREIKH